MRGGQLDWRMGLRHRVELRRAGDRSGQPHDGAHSGRRGEHVVRREGRSQHLPEHGRLQRLRRGVRVQLDFRRRDPDLLRRDGQLHLRSGPQHPEVQHPMVRRRQLQPQQPRLRVLQVRCTLRGARISIHAHCGWSGVGAHHELQLLRPLRGVRRRQLERL